MFKASGVWMGIVYIIFGVLVLLFPDLLRWLVGVFLIVAGAMALAKR